MILADKIIEDYLAEKEGKQISCDGWSNEEMENISLRTIFRAQSVVSLTSQEFASLT